MPNQLTEEEYYEAMREYEQWLAEQEADERLVRQWEEEQNNG
jgi:hypothetical protein